MIRYYCDRCGDVLPEGRDERSHRSELFKASIPQESPSTNRRVFVNTSATIVFHRQFSRETKPVLCMDCKRSLADVVGAWWGDGV